MDSSTSKRQAGVVMADYSPSRYLSESILSNLKSCNNTFEIFNRLTDIPVIRKVFLEHQPGGDNYLNDLQARINSLHSRISKNKFEVAVIGPEGSGKSSFINALIGEDILPTDPNSRCTYASVEIHPVENNSEAHVEIAMKNVEDFEAYVADLRESIEKPEGRITQLGTAAFESELKMVIDEGGVIVPEIAKFLTGEVLRTDVLITDNSIEFDVRNADDMLKRYTFRDFVTDKYLARAVKYIRLYIPTNMNTEAGNNFIIYDIPGYNSPLTYHQKQTEYRLKSADVVVCVYSLAQDRVNIDSTTSNIMDISNLLDRSIDIRNKLFVFINKCDRLSQSEFQSRVAIAKDEWSKYCKTENIVVGSALGHLTKIGVFANDEVIEQLTSLAMINLDGTVNAGIESIISKMQRYIDEDCLKVYEKVSEDYINATIAVINELRSIIEEKYGFSAPRDSDEEKRINSIRVNAFKKWFNHKWNTTMKEFDVWYYDNIINDTEETQKMHENLLNMDAIIGEFVDEVKETTEFNIDEYVNRTMVAGVPQINLTNYELRKRLHELSICRLDDISRKMAANLTSATRSILDKLCDMFYGIGSMELSNSIYETEDADRVQLSYKAAINALFVRFARPIVDIYVSKPRGTLDRSVILDKYRIDVEILKLYYEKTSNNAPSVSQSVGAHAAAAPVAAAAPSATVTTAYVAPEEPAKPVKKDRFSFRAQRREEEPAAVPPVAQEPVQPEPETVLENEVANNEYDTFAANAPKSFSQRQNSERLLNSIINNLNSNSSAASVEQIKDEISDDAESMGTLLRDIFYTASGINNYCMQEFERIRREVYLSKNLFWSLLYDACNDGMINDFEINFKEKEIIYRQYINLIRSYEILK